jgi:hypothetical protein
MSLSAALLLLASTCFVSCNSKPDESKSQQELLKERLEQPALFLTESGKEVIAEDTSGSATVDPNTGEIAWRTYVCNAANCTGKGEGDRPYIFIWKDPFIEKQSDGTVGRINPPTDVDINEFVKQRGGYMYPTCPLCVKKRDLANETQDQADDFAGTVLSYELPEVVERRKEIDEHLKK